MRARALSLLLGLALSLPAIGGTVVSSAGVPQNVFLLTDQATCPSGYTEVTTYAGRYLVGIATVGSAGDTLGTGAATTTTNSSYTPSGTNATAAFTPAGTNGTAAFTPVGTNATSAFTPAGTNATAAFTPAGTVASTFAGTPIVTTTAPFLVGLLPAITTVGGSTTTHTPAGVVTSTLTGTPGTVPAEVFTGTPGTVPAQVFTGTAGTVPGEAFTGTPGTVPAEAFTGTANATMRSTIAPSVSLRLCKRN